MKPRVLVLRALVCFMIWGLLPELAEASPASKPARAQGHAPLSAKKSEPKWRTETRTEIRKRLRTFLKGIDLSACTSNTEWSLVVYPNAKRSAKIIMKELAPHLKAKLTAKQKKAMSKRIRYHVMGAIIRTEILAKRQHNLGVIRLKGRTWTDAKGQKKPLLIFRGAFTAAPTKAGSCVQFLLHSAKVRHLVSLYDGDLLAVEDLRNKERLAAKKVNASYMETRSLGDRYGHWRHALQQQSTFQNPKTLRQVMRQVALLINEQILRPQGKSPRGNVFFHCGGGMHRSGVLAGVLRRCINNDPIKKIGRLHRYHSAYTSATLPGGYEPLLLRFIRLFDCSLLSSK